MKTKWIAVCVLTLVAARAFVAYQNNTSEMVTLKPWANVGGCGAGGSGGGSGDGIQWIGEGVSGGLVDLELMTKTTVGQNFQNFSLTPKFSFHPSYSATLDISLPFQAKSAEVQYRSNQLPNDRSTGGTGDLNVNYSLTAGGAGQHNLSLGLTLPTGQYDIKRGKSGEEEFLPASLQKGGGIYNLSLGFGSSGDTEEGLWMYNLGLSWPFQLSVEGKNAMMEEYFTNYHQFEDDDRFYYNFKPYGESDFGDYTPPSLSLGAYYGYRGQEDFVHSFGVTFGAPLGVAWIRSEKLGEYNPKPDPDHKSWSAAFVYGLEFSREEFPVFVGFSLPFHAKNAPAPEDEFDASALEAWQAPDWSDFLQQWNLAVGIKSTFL